MWLRSTSTCENYLNSSYLFHCCRVIELSVHFHVNAAQQKALRRGYLFVAYRVPTDDSDIIILHICRKAVPLDVLQIGEGNGCRTQARCCYAARPQPGVQHVDRKSDAETLCAATPLVLQLLLFLSTPSARACGH